MYTMMMAMDLLEAFQFQIVCLIFRSCTPFIGLKDVLMVHVNVLKSSISFLLLVKGPGEYCFVV